MGTMNRRRASRAMGAALALAAWGAATPAGAAGHQGAAAGTAQKILFVVTSHDRKGQDLVAGFWFPELTHPARVLAEAGLAFDIASPQGGMPPFDGFDLKDAGNAWFWIQPQLRNQLARSLPLDQVDATRYAAVVLVGGHGPMWDFVNNPALHAVVRSIYERGGIVGAVCHGPAGLLGLQLSNGQSLIAGRRLTAFTNAEEVARQYDTLIPFALQTALLAEGAVFEEAPVFQNRVVVDGRLITGQNPASAHAFGQAVAAAVQARAA